MHDREEMETDLPFAKANKHSLTQPLLANVLLNAGVDIIERIEKKEMWKSRKVGPRGEGARVHE